MQKLLNHYFDASSPLRPYTHSLLATPGTVRPSNALRVDLPFTFAGDGHPAKENVPAEFKGFWPCEKDGAWVLVEDHRSEQGYINGEPHTIKDVGPRPDGWSDTPPPQPFHPGSDYEELGGGEWVRVRYTKKDFLLWCGVDKLMAMNREIEEGNYTVKTMLDLLMASEFISIKDPDTVQMLGMLTTPAGGSLLTQEEMQRILTGQVVYEPDTEAA
jgi:hypothetical protein